MEKIIKVISVIFLGLFLAINFVSASEVGGGINPGISTGIDGTVVTAPTANVPSGTYTSTQNVSLAAIGSLSAHYTTDGIDPTCSNPNTYSAPIVISSTSTLKAIACYGNGVTSSISSFDYVINLPTYAPPTASPLGGTYTSAQSVTLTAAGSSSIRYTTDGTNPTCSAGTVYSNAISISLSQTIKAIACYGENSSDVASFAYTININTGGGGGGGGGGNTPTPTPTTPATIKTGDANGDNKVDKYDFALMMSNWGKTGTNTGDFNGDGKVDKYDFALLMLNWSI
jgi:hypothetical protein